MKTADRRLLLMPFALAASAFAASPAPPAEFRLSVYSDSTLELFWTGSADDGRAAGYELLRNGEVRFIGRATGYLDRGLDGRSSVRYQLVTIDRDGTRSEPSATLVYEPRRGAVEASCYSASRDSASDGRGSSSSSRSSSSSSSSSSSRSSSTSGPGERAGSAAGCSTVDGARAGVAGDGVRDLRGEVYSASALEIFWNAPLSSDVVTSYEVLRDGRWRARTDGISLFDDGLEAGRLYSYAVRALSAEGIRSSDTAWIDLRTPAR